MYTKEELAAVKREYNPYEFIGFFPDSGKFQVSIPHARYRPVFDSLIEACLARDRMLQSPHFPQAKRYEPRTDNACYVDPNLESRPY